MSNRAMLVDYEWCTGCHSCELSCQMKNNLPVGQFGIKITEIGPWQYDDKKWQYTYVPMITDQCNMCADRIEAGKMPLCVQHCQSGCIEIGDVEQLKLKMTNKSKQLLIQP